MIFIFDWGKILWEIIIFFTYILICGALIKQRFTKTVCLIISGTVLALIFFGQVWMFFSCRNIMKVLTLLPLTAYLPSILCLHIVSKSKFFQTVAIWTTGLLVYRILKTFLKILIQSFSVKDSIAIFLITVCLSLASVLLLFLVFRFLCRPFRTYTEGSQRNWVFLCFPVLIMLLLVSYLGSMSKNMPLQLLILFHVLAVFFLLVSALVAFASVERMKESERILAAYMQAQRREYEEMCVKMEAGRIYRHDMRHHLIVLKNLAKKGDNGRIVEYIGDLCGQLSNTEHKVYCQNPTVNAVLSAYIEEAEKYCAVETKINIPRELPYDELDICAVLANALENAKNECMKIGEKEKCYIRINADLKENKKLFLCIENSCNEPIKFGTDNLPIAPKAEGHGIGLKSICAIIKKYSGMLHCECCDGIFRLNTVLFYAHKETPGHRTEIYAKKSYFFKKPISLMLTGAFFFFLLIVTILLLTKVVTSEQEKDRIQGNKQIHLIDWGDLLFCANVSTVQLEGIYEKAFEEYIAQMKEKFLSYANEKYMGYVGGDITYEVFQNNNHFLSVRFDTTINLGSSVQYCRCLTMDRQIGKIINLDDLFMDGYIKVISAEILRQMEEQVARGQANYFIPGGIWKEEECFKEITADTNFYINTENELVIVFDEYEVAPGSMGMPEFVIPEEILEGIRR